VSKWKSKRKPAAYRRGEEPQRRLAAGAAGERVVDPARSALGEAGRSRLRAQCDQREKSEGRSATTRRYCADRHPDHQLVRWPDRHAVRVRAHVRQRVAVRPAAATAPAATRCVCRDYVRCARATPFMFAYDDRAKDSAAATSPSSARCGSATRSTRWRRSESMRDRSIERAVAGTPRRRRTL